MPNLNEDGANLDEGDFIVVSPLPRDSEFEEENGASFQRAMREAGAHLLKKGFESDSLNVTLSVQVPGEEDGAMQAAASNPSPHDVLSYADIMALEGCGESKARIVLRSVPKAYKLGRSWRVLRKDYEEWCSDGAAKKIKWPKRRR